MATLPIYLEVEHRAVGPLLIGFRNNPDIVTVAIPLGAPHRVVVPRQHGARSKAQELIIASFIKANGRPLTLVDLRRETSLTRTSIYDSLKGLSHDNIVKRGEFRGTWQLSEKAKREKVGDAARISPSPTKSAARVNKKEIERGPSGRVSRGIGRALLLQALAAGTNTRADLIKHLSERGISPKSAQVMLERTKRDKAITSNGRGAYALTARGQRIVAEVAPSLGKRKH
jgi:hypothetical protein